MRKARAILSVLFILMAISARAQKEKPGVEVKEFKFCTGIEEREPTGVNSQFFNSADRIFCYTRITGVTGDISIYHQWYFGEKEMAKVELRVESSDWRTWSSKRIADSWSGVWRVDIVLEDGRKIASQEFIYKPVDEE
ncbi:MAG: DUF2914 domain-containing protein [Candidatus Krumholzibacteriota bacterium]|nr:DUF2914 domain-containing protein [Candidatus Krumholzibacteriota bacterium]